MIVQFPLKGTLEKSVEQLQETLDDLYHRLDDYHVALNDLEAEANQKEREYNCVLEKYAKAVGTENIPLGYLEYSTQALMYLADGEEIVFTKEED